VSFVIPDVPDLKFDTITIYGMQIIGNQRSHDMAYPSVHGSWQPREHVEFSVRVLKEYADSSLGWNLTFCVGSAAGCYPSPNLLTLITQNEQSSNQASPQAATGAAPADLKTLRPQGMDAYRQGDYTGALRIFRQVIAADPSDIVAYNVAANCSLRLKDYPSAIEYFKHALQLQPDEYHNMSGLIRAYTLAGMAPERDELRKHITELEHVGMLPDDFNYVFEAFDTGDKKIEVAEFPKIQGFYGERYRFKVFNSAGKEIYCITLEFDSLEQPEWAKKHPKEAAAGGRRFSLDGYASDSHSTFAFYDGEPPYEHVREEAKQILSGKKQAISKTAYSSPQPIPGAE
jgi:tetratricopeptide (TPR) repeat protein